MDTVLELDTSELRLLNACEQDYPEDIDIFKGDYDTFFREHLCKNVPCIMSNAVYDWPSFKLWVKNGKPDFQYLDSSYGDANVPVADCNKRYFNAQEKNTMKFSDFLDYWKEYRVHSSLKPCLYLKDWHFVQHFPHEEIYRVPMLFSSDWLNEYFTSKQDVSDDYKFVYMGPKGSWTPLHVDVFTSYSWSANICGKKKWILFPPGEEEKLKDKQGNLFYDVMSIDQTNDDNNNDLLGDVKHCYVIQEAGDCIFVPSGWHHQVLNLEDTISINHNWINGCNVKQMWNSIRRNLAAVKKEIGHLTDMEDWNEHCQLLLKSCYGMDYRELYEFLTYIRRVREHCLDSQKELEVYGRWKHGGSHLKFDISVANVILNELLNDDDMKQLNYFKQLTVDSGI